MKQGRSLFLLLLIGAADLIILGVLVLQMAVGIETAAGAEGSAVEPKYVALTFDDGPSREYTKLLLDGLRERDVQASFFLLGTCIPGNEDLVEQMERDGHLIGVHGMKHRDLTKEKPKDAVMQIRETAEMIAGITGKEPEYLRPPFGNWNEKLGAAVEKELAMVPVFWDVDSLDWKVQDSGKIVKKVLEDVENGDIILFHDTFDSSVEAVLQLIDKLKAKGYTFLTADELMVD